MEKPFTHVGKQIMASGSHYADAADETAAQFMLDALNTKAFGITESLLDALEQMVRQHAAAGQNWRQGLADAQQSGNRDLAVEIQNGPMVVLNGFPVEAARAAIARATGAGA